ncbi:MAG: hypothetical protein ACYC2P_01800 [Paludibacteraceae bacterium]
MITKKTFLMCFIILSVCLVQGQTIAIRPPSVVPVSPEAASITKYTSYPVDYSTGIPDISIPLYEIKVGDIYLPITLSYHSSGLKPKEPSGRIGTGWTLNAEPSIMRNIKGLPDDGNISSIFSGNATFSNETYQRIIDGMLDSEPDFYNYSLNPGSGAGYYVNHQFVSYPRNSDKVIFQTLDSALITNGEGLVYHFGNGDIAKEKTEITRLNPQTTRWLCTRITSLKTNAEIKFSYQSGNYANVDYYYNMHDSKIVEQGKDKTKNLFSDMNKKTIYELTVKNGLNKLSINNQYLSPIVNYSGGNRPINVRKIKLSNILFNENTVQFGYNSAYGDEISEIIIMDASGNQLRRIEFFITKYNANTLLTKLDSIRISASGCQQRIYRFKYDGCNGVPSQETTGIDHWGYYNGQNNLEGGVPTIITKVPFYDTQHGVEILIDTVITGADREPNANMTKVGMLQEIINPEGGITTLEYEGNFGGFSMYYRGDNCDKYCHYKHPVGGVRILNIKESVFNKNLQKHTFAQKKYTYGLKVNGDNSDPIIGGGAIKHIVTNLDYCFESEKKFNINGSVIGKVKTWFAMPVSDITFDNGSSVLYSYVQEDVEDEESKVKLTSRYYYDITHHDFDALEYINQYDTTRIIKTTFWDLVSRQESIPANRVIRKDITRPYDIDNAIMDLNNDQRHGHLVKKEYYKQDTLISSVSYMYDDTKTRHEQGQQIWTYKPYFKREYITEIAADFNYWQDPYSSINYDPYYPQNKVENSEYSSGGWQLDVHQWKALIKETTIQYFYKNGSTQIVESEKNYDYTDYRHINPTEIISTNYGQNISDKFGYNPNMVNVLAYHKHAVNNDSTVSVIDFADNNRPIKVRNKTGKTNTFIDRISYDRYDAYGNIAEISTNSGKHTCYIWSYSNQYPVAKIDNITYSNLLQALSKDETWIKELGNKYMPLEQDMILLNSLRDKLTASLVSTFTYQPLLGISSVTNASGYTIYYKYDNLGRLTETYSYENGAKKVMQNNSYNISNAIFSLPDNSFIINGSNIESLTLLEGGKDFLFEVYVYGGSGNFKYEWDLFCGVFGTSDYHSHGTPITLTNQVAMMPVYHESVNPSINKLWIQVTDQATNQQKVYETYFYVGPPRP